MRVLRILSFMRFLFSGVSGKAQMHAMGDMDEESEEDEDFDAGSDQGDDDEEGDEDSDAEVGLKCRLQGSDVSIRLGKCRKREGREGSEG